MHNHRKIALILLLPLLLMFFPGTALANIDVNAGSAILMEASTGQILYEKNSDQALPPASITKIMTLLVIFEALEKEQITWDEKVMVSENAWRMQGSQMFLEIGQEVTVRDLVKGISIISGNDACVAMAEHLYGSEAAFVRVMNERAQELGLKNTKFQNSTGWPAENHYMSAKDIAILAQYLISTYPEVIEFEAQKEFTFNNIRQYNRNTLLGRYPGADGLKTGLTTEAGYCLVATAVQNDIRMISVVLNTASEEARHTASQEILNYGFRNFEPLEIAKAGETVGQVNIHEGRKKLLNVTVAEDYTVFIPHDSKDKIEQVLVAKEDLKAPIKKGEIAGTLEIRSEDEIITSVDVVAQEDMKRANILVRAFRWIGGFFSGLFSKG